MDVREIRELSDEKLLDALEDKRMEIFNLRFQKASGQMENTNALKYARHDLARLLTVQRERERAAQAAGEE